MIVKIINFFSSLKLAVACLAMSLVLVFIGTLAQVKLGLYVAQEEYFQSLLVMWGPQGADWKIPIWPGGYLLGGVLLFNLIAAHIKRFQFSSKKAGIILIHSGLILLFIGQFLTEVLQVESNMRIEEGQSKDYAENTRLNELAIIESFPGSQSNKVVAFVETILKKDAQLSHSELPFTIRVKEHFLNSIPQLPTEKESDVISAKQGAGEKVHFKQEPITATMDDENKPVALVEVSAQGKVLGEWAVSTWLSKHPWSSILMEQLGNRTGPLLMPQSFEVNGKTYEIALRPARYYKPFSLTLLDFSHDRYLGTEIPKNFSSRVQLSNPSTSENREILIYMNNPLRYNGETYYQASFERGDKTTILHVVKNPAWLTPYFSCVLVGFGLSLHFFIHLLGFFKKRQQQMQNTGATSRPVRKPEGISEPSIATTKTA